MIDSYYYKCNTQWILKNVFFFYILAKLNVNCLNKTLHKWKFSWEQIWFNIYGKKIWQICNVNKRFVLKVQYWWLILLFYNCLHQLTLCTLADMHCLLWPCYMVPVCSYYEIYNWAIFGDPSSVLKWHHILSWWPLCDLGKYI
jgi:hypothetical protein